MKTLTEVKDIRGAAGDFEVELLQHPRYIDVEKCIGCGACAEKCPKKTVDTYNMGLAKRKAAYVEYPQAVPLKYAIDPKECIFLQKGKCGACKKICPTGAVDFDQKPAVSTVRVGAVVLAPGFVPFDPARYDNYQYAKLPNVMTAMEFERMLSASGPTQGHVKRLSKDGREPKKIAWFQCVGSRDMNRCDNAYCSAVCCMYAVKEAVIAKEHVGPGLDCAVFFMDMRTHGKEFERFYDDARERHGVRFIRSRVHSVTPVGTSDDLEVRYIAEDGSLHTEVFDLVVLSIGMEVSPPVLDLARRLGLELTPGRFCRTASLTPVASSREGIYVCGAFPGPKDIPQSVIDASAAATAAGEVLAPARGSRTRTKEKVPEVNVANERPRIGVFVCRCGTNIAGVVDVPAVAEYAKSLPYVEFATDNLYSCSQDTQETISKIIREKNLNRVVVAACTPKTHEPLFQETLVNAGLNKYLFEMANIRNQDSWVHKSSPELATRKAKDLVRMAVEKAALLSPLKEAELEIHQSALVVGGGLSGMAAARSLARQGYTVHLVEKESRLGGQAWNLHRTARGEHVPELLSSLIAEIEADPRIQVHLGVEIARVEGFVGNFKTTLQGKDGAREVEHGVAILATGGRPYRPSEYGYGTDPRILTALELDRRILDGDPALGTLASAVFIQCVGSREPDRPYCSRVCCTHAVDNAIHLKQLNPEMNVFVLYRDMRTYGERELLYKKARELGVIFVRFSRERKPEVHVEGGRLLVRVFDPILGRALELEADLVTLATAILPQDNGALAQFFKVPLNADGFFVERHAKLGPSEFATDGVFLCGLAHYPKPIDEAIAQGQAAASRAVTLLARKTLYTSGTVAEVDPRMCSRCGVCVSICPYSAPSWIEKGPFAERAQINPVLCKGCGLCVASCRSGAIHLKGFDNDQIFAQIFSLREAV